MVIFMFLSGGALWGAHPGPHSRSLSKIGGGAKDVLEAKRTRKNMISIKNADLIVF